MGTKVQYYRGHGNANAIIAREREKRAIISQVNYTLYKTPCLYILNNSLKTESISVIFGVQYPDEISHQNITNLPTSPE